jgi:hypothetical protein
MALALVVVMGATASACSGTKMYTDTAYGYSFAYPDDWKVKAGTTDVTAGGAVSGNVGVYNPAGTEVDQSFVDLALIMVYNLQDAVPEPWVPSVQTELQKVLSSLEKQTAGVNVEQPLKQAEAGGLKGYSVTYTFTKSGTPMRSTLYFLFDGTREYELNEQAAVAAWDRTKPDLDEIIASFKPGKIK